MKIYVCPHCGNAIEYNTFIEMLEYTEFEEIDFNTGKTINTGRILDWGTPILCPSCGLKIQADKWILKGI